jgi:hypothetical protein
MAKSKSTSKPAVNETPNSGPSAPVDIRDACERAHSSAEGINNLLCAVASSDAGIMPEAAEVLQQVAERLVSDLAVVKSYFDGEE